MSTVTIETSPTRTPLKKSKPSLERPKRWGVIILDDPVTSFHAVEHMLREEFGKNAQEAAQIRHTVHTQGKGLADIFANRDIAETKAEHARKFMHARYPLFPLRIDTEAMPE